MFITVIHMTTRRTTIRATKRMTRTRESRFE